MLKGEKVNDKLKTDVVWKYPLETTYQQTITVPIGSKFLSLIEQGGVPTMYFLVNDSEETKETIVISMRGTGHPVEREMSRASQYIGTISTFGGQLIWHLWMK